MIEPRPEMKLPPEGNEPVLRVGIVLAEDQKRSITISVPDEGYFISSTEKTIALQPGKEYQVENKDSQLRVSGPQVANILITRGPICIRAESPQTLAPKSGVSVDSIVAGRGFHWQKEIVQTLPGNLEVHPAGDLIVLVNVLGFENYLSCVVSSEMSPDCPEEFIKAQGVAARSWAFAFLNTRYENQPFTICNDDNSQRYQGTTHLSQKSIDAITSSRGEFLVTPQGNVCAAYYSKGCGGHTELPENVFGFSVEGIEPVLDAPQDSAMADINLTTEEGFSRWLNTEEISQGKIFCSSATVDESKLLQYLGAVDVEGTYFRWKHELPADQIIRNLRDKFQIRNVKAILDLSFGPRGASGRSFALDIQYRTSSGEERSFSVKTQYEIRQLLHESFLYSSAFQFHCIRADSGEVETVYFKGAGWGHGVGFCQIGALGMALTGSMTVEILKHYYPACTLSKAYE